MAGSITSVLFLQMTLCTVSATPIYVEIDDDIEVGTDNTPLKVRFISVKI